jgi:asparagine synthase (glutamine-hydrolysing)
MCGFCVSINDQYTDIKKMTELIKHRGPDSTKYIKTPKVNAGFNRLAVVDLDERSDQPMYDETERYLILFNGEIYNHKHLKKLLCQSYGITFKTSSDTEVLLEGLIKEGSKFINKLDGIFAFIFIDLSNLNIIMGRDPFGVKRLYYIHKKDQLIVSSELKPFNWEKKKKIKEKAIVEFMSFGTVFDNDTYFDDVKELSSNSFVEFSLNEENPKNFKIKKYKDLNYDNDNKNDADPETITYLVKETIKKQTPEIPFAVSLSGGIDSTLILDEVHSNKFFTATYCVDVKHSEMSERKWQNYVIDKLNLSKKTKWIDLRDTDFSIKNLKRLSKLCDYPIFHPNYVGSLHLTEKVKSDGIKVLLSGEGADEIFLGYRWFEDFSNYSEFLEYIPFDIVKDVFRNENIKNPNFNQLSLTEAFQKVYLQRWLLRQDLTGMVNSVEVRVPFLGIELAERLNKLSFDFKIKKDFTSNSKIETKWLLKRILRNKYSDEFIDRKKIGFDFPLNEWINDEHLEFLRSRRDLFNFDLLFKKLQNMTPIFMRKRLLFSCVSYALWFDNLKK